MRVVTVGAGGNVGTALLRRLHTEPDLDLIGVSRRRPAPDGPYADVEWHVADIGAENATAGLADVFRGSAAVVNLAWQIQPSHDRRRLYRANVLGSRAVFRAAITARAAHRHRRPRRPGQPATHRRPRRPGRRGGLLRGRLPGKGNPN